ncbi:MAG: lytic transglycosylase domain-containing protein [Oligoflexia bacterium]|nr:lytic transglycosylase domain-containing protein [Oligoflexia bacterium]
MIFDTKKFLKADHHKNERDVVRSIKKVNSVFLKNEKDIDKTKAELSGVDLKIFNIFIDSAKLDYLSEAGDLKNIRTQAGLRDGLEDALFISGRYLPRMKDVFKNFGLPEEISYLPFVESGFNKKAVSKVGASGIWQFMPYTGKLYLRVNDVIDERNDPMRAAEAAARLMSGNYKALGKWSLAITAYNHGRAGVANAVKTTGSDKLNEIIENYQSPSFGFASKNFFVCFVGAMYVVKNSDTLIGEIPRAKKLEFDEFVMPHYMSVEDFLAGMDIDLFTFKELNPALTPTVYKGERRIPIGYTVRVPIENREDFLPRYERISKTKKFDTQIEDELGKEKGLASVESSTKTSP